MGERKEQKEQHIKHGHFLQISPHNMATQSKFPSSTGSFTYCYAAQDEMSSLSATALCALPDILGTPS
jgi:hypothetical protein